MTRKNLVIGIYYHPEAFPPTLNAVAELSRYFSAITILHRPNLHGNWQYPDNAQPIASGDFITAADQIKAPALKKILFFIHFVYDLLKCSIRSKPSVILLYDTQALFAYSLIRPFLFFKHMVWYHNHDIAEIIRLKKYSVGWFASKAEQRLFNKIDIFTLPAVERLAYFPMNQLKGRHFVIPNYPSISFYSQFYQPEKLSQPLKLIFQGHIGGGHGLEEILPLLKDGIRGKELQLVLKGYCEIAYKEELLSVAATFGVRDKIFFEGFTAYRDVPRLAAGCHIGIGIFSKKETMHLTLGTASNKIYEYAALGLPVLYSAAPAFEKYLGKYNWAFPVATTTKDIADAIARIDRHYETYSRSAVAAFREQLNFEHYFKQVTDYLVTKNCVLFQSQVPADQLHT